MVILLKASGEEVKNPQVPVCYSQFSKTKPGKNRTSFHNIQVQLGPHLSNEDDIPLDEFVCLFPVFST
jgi:hypothetical protein